MQGEVGVATPQTVQPRALLYIEDVGAQLGKSPDAMHQWLHRWRQGLTSAEPPPMVKIDGRRLACTPESFAAWIRRKAAEAA